MGEEEYENSRKRPHEESPEEYSNKRSNGQKTNAGSGKPLLKMLIPNYLAGKLIGKGGSNINELQTTFDAHIQISSSKEFYPGTDDRVVTIAANIDQIIEFNKYMIEKVQEEQDSERRPMNSNSRQDVKMVVTNVAAGLVIGKGGSTIKAIQEQTNAKINISKRDEGVTGERVLVIIGDADKRINASSQVIEKMAEEPDKMSNNVKYSSLNNSLNMQQATSLYNNFQTSNGSSLLFNGVPNVHAQIMGGQMGGVGNNYDNSNYEAKCKAKVRFQCEMEIPDNLVGAVLGKQGQNVNEFIRATGAKLQFSAKNEFAPGTTDRILTITGGINNIRNAYQLVDQKVAQVEQEFAGNRWS